jgi:hypothetical protein
MGGTHSGPSHHHNQQLLSQQQHHFHLQHHHQQALLQHYPSLAVKKPVWKVPPAVIDPDIRNGDNEDNIEDTDDNGTESKSNTTSKKRKLGKGQKVPVVAQLCAIVDLQGVGMSNMNYELIPVLYDLFHRHFPQIFGTVVSRTQLYIFLYTLIVLSIPFQYVLNFGWIHAGVWSIMKAMLTAEACEKLLFLSKAEMLLHFNPEDLLPEHGGVEPPPSSSSAANPHKNQFTSPDTCPYFVYYGSDIPPAASHNLGVWNMFGKIQEIEKSMHPERFTGPPPPLTPSGLHPTGSFLFGTNGLASAPTSSASLVSLAGVVTSSNSLHGSPFHHSSHTLHSNHSHHHSHTHPLHHHTHLNHHFHPSSFDSPSVETWYDAPEYPLTPVRSAADLQMMLRSASGNRLNSSGIGGLNGLGPMSPSILGPMGISAGGFQWSGSGGGASSSAVNSSATYVGMPARTSSQQALGGKVSGSTLASIPTQLQMTPVVPKLIMSGPLSPGLTNLSSPAQSSLLQKRSAMAKAAADGNASSQQLDLKQSSDNKSVWRPISSFGLATTPGPPTPGAAPSRTFWKRFWRWVFRFIKSIYRRLLLLPPTTSASPSGGNQSSYFKRRKSNMGSRKTSATSIIHDTFGVGGLKKVEDIQSKRTGGVVGFVVNCFIRIPWVVVVGILRVGWKVLSRFLFGKKKGADGRRLELERNRTSDSGGRSPKQQSHVVLSQKQPQQQQHQHPKRKSPKGGLMMKRASLVSLSTSSFAAAVVASKPNENEDEDETSSSGSSLVSYSSIVEKSVRVDGDENTSGNSSSVSDEDDDADNEREDVKKPKRKVGKGKTRQADPDDLSSIVSESESEPPEDFQKGFEADDEQDDPDGSQEREISKEQTRQLLLNRFWNRFQGRDMGLLSVIAVLVGAWVIESAGVRVNADAVVSYGGDGEQFVEDGVVSVINSGISAMLATIFSRFGFKRENGVSLSMALMSSLSSLSVSQAAYLIASQCFRGLSFVKMGIQTCDKNLEAGIDQVVGDMGTLLDDFVERLLLA